MKKKYCAIVALCLALSVLCSCSQVNLSWFTDRFQTQSSESQEQTPVEEEETDPEKPETTEVVTEIFSELDAFGLAYQSSYGLHPYQCESLNNRVILSFLYEPLFAVTTNYEPVAILASSWEVSSDGLQTTIYLQRGVQFHNGSNLTAQDVIYSLQSSIGSKYYGTRLRDITDMQAPDDYTVVLTTSVSYECLPLLLDMPIIPMDSNEAAIPPGTGPYCYSTTLQLLRNHSWWQDTAPLVDYENIKLTLVDTTADIRDNFEYENVNLVLTDPNSSAYAGFHNDYELWDQPTTILQYIGYNISTKVFSNYGLRSAITYAIDRDEIVTQIMGGFATSAVLPCSEQTSYHDTKLAGAYGFNIANYRLQLESASVEDMDNNGILDLYVSSLGYAVPVSGTMIVCSSNYQRVEAASEVVEALNALGFDLTLEALELSEYQKALQNGEFDLYYGEVRLSPNFDLSPFFQYGGTLSFGSLAESTMQNLCNLALVNNGNTYNLYKRICERGYITPVLFKSLAVYTTRGAISNPVSYIDWFLPVPAEQNES